MFRRYKTDENGRSVPVASIYSQKEHSIRNADIDKDALWAIKKIQNAGGEAYIVGGAIRDMLLGRKPKDFDIATSLSPRQVQRLFWNARIIGRRFRIVHLFFGQKIIEVTTFRSDEENFEDGRNNMFGTMEQDAHRRDFSINSLYYNPENGQLLDFTDSMPDFRKKVIRSLIPLSYSFREDPVRMIRAVKYKVTTGFRLKWNVRFAIRKYAPYLSLVSVSRITEEVMKILSSGESAKIFALLDSYKLLAYILPCLTVYINFDGMKRSLEKLDEEVRDAKEKGKGIDRSRLLYHLAKPVLTLRNADELSDEERFHEIFREIKVLVNPITPPNYEIEKAASLALEDMGYKRKVRKKEKRAKEDEKVMRKKSSYGKRMRRRKKVSPTPQSQS